MSKVKNSVFAEYVASSAFALTLSKKMIQTLLWIASDDYRKNNLSTFITHAGALVRRGLVWHKPHYYWCETHKKMLLNVNKRAWHLTEEGKLVVQLLKLAGHSIKPEKVN